MQIPFSTLSDFLQEATMKVIQLISKIWRANKLSKAYAWNRPQDL